MTDGYAQALEAAARVADAGTDPGPYCDEFDVGCDLAARNIAAAIRALPVPAAPTDIPPHMHEVLDYLDAHANGWVSYDEQDLLEDVVSLTYGAKHFNSAAQRRAAAIEAAARLLHAVGRMA